MLQAAGIESYIMNTYRRINKNEFQYDFFITRDQKEFYDDEISALGGRKFCVDFQDISSTFKRVIKESRYLKEFLMKNHYDVIHIHSGTPLRFMYLIAAKKAGVKTRIYHSHSAKVKGPHKLIFLKHSLFKLFKQFIPFYATDLFACSELAGEWMYPKRCLNKVHVVKNGIDINLFDFNAEKREQMREELNVDDNFVIVHVGRFNAQKNHVFLMNMFEEVLKEIKNAKLLLVGEGELYDEIYKLVESKELMNAVDFLGVRSDVSSILQASDIFVLPSNYEGLPVVGIEAQSTGTYCLLSENVTSEIKITDNIELLPIDSFEPWVNAMKKQQNNKKSSVRDDIINSGYEIQTTVNFLEKFYSGDKV